MRATNPVRSLSRLLVLALLLSFIPALTVHCGEPPRAPHLRLETGMHAALIRRINVDRDNRFLVTGSSDKTVRVWELPSLRLIRTLRPPIGDGYEGNICAVDISPDGRTIAAAGWTGGQWDKKVSIYLFDRESGRMTRPEGLQGLPRFVNHLVYSKDGSLLAVTMRAGGGLRVYRIPDYALVARDDAYGSNSEDADFDVHGRLVTISNDGFVRLYGKELKLLQKVRAAGGNNPFTVSFSPDGSMIAVGFKDSQSVAVLSGNDLSHLYSNHVQKGMSAGAVCWSLDGRFLYAGTWYRLPRIIRRWSDGGRGGYVDLDISSRLRPDESRLEDRGYVLGLKPLKDGGITFATTRPSFGVFDADGKLTLYKAAPVADYTYSPGSLLVSPDALTVQFPFEVGGKSPAFFSILGRQLERADAISAVAISQPEVSVRRDSRYGASPLSPPSTSDTNLEIRGWSEHKTVPTLNGLPLSLREGENSNSLAIAPGGQSFLVGTIYRLILFDRDGNQKWQKPSPSGSVVAVNISHNGKVAVAAINDGTIRWYRLTDGRELLVLFPHADRKRWVLWTPSGYYDASPGGEDLIGWHVNNGPDQAADFFPISRFRSTYYRPDVIQEVLKTLDENEAVKLANNKAGIKEPARPVRETLPPVVEIVSPGDKGQVGTKTLTIRYNVRSPGGDPITDIRVQVDGGQPRTEPPKPTRSGGWEVQVPIPERDCEIGITAQNRHGWGEPAKRQMTWTGSKDREKGVLYVLAIGVSNYRDEALRQGVKYAAKDAKDFAKFMKEQKRGRLYRDVQVEVLSDEEATKNSISDFLNKWARGATVYDVMVLFVAGHGEQDRLSRKYRYLLADVDKNRYPSQCLSLSDIKDWVVVFPGRRVVFIDTCRSGSTIDNTGFANELGSSETGISVLTSASGSQDATEVEGNGLFTKVLLEGFNGKAADDQGRVTVGRLGVLVQEEVEKITKGNQTPAILDYHTGRFELAEVITRR